MSSNGEKVLEIISDRNKNSIILKMIEDDCTQLYNYYCLNQDELKGALEIYEEFITVEINRVFELANSFNDIMIAHQISFYGFLQSMGIYNVPQPQAKRQRTDRFFVIYISVQNWLLHGQKGPQFYSMVDIDAFNYQEWDASTAAAQLVSIFSYISISTSNLHQTYEPQLVISIFTKTTNLPANVNGADSRNRMANLSKYGEPATTFLIFQNHLPFTCNAAMKNSVRHIQDALSECTVDFRPFYLSFELTYVSQYYQRIIA